MDETLKGKTRLELNKIKSMTFKEKREYIWEYYKIPIISVVVTVAILASIINSVFINPPKKTYAHLTIFGPYVESTIMDELAADITERIVEDKENYMIYTSNFYDNPQDIETNMAMQQKFFAMIAANELDIIIGAEEDIGALAVEGTLLEFTDILNADGIEAADEDLLVTATVDSDQEKPFAVRIHDSAAMSAHGLDANGYYMGLIVNTKRIDEAVQVMQILLGSVEP